MSEIDEPRAPAPKQVIQRASNKPESAGEKVTVYCSLPNGMRLRGFRMVKQREQVLGGGTREFEIAEPFGGEVLALGSRFRKGADATHRVVAGYGVTPGVDKEFWEAWLKANEDRPYVRNGLIFAAKSRDYGDAEAEDRQDTRSGFEPMEKDGDPRSPRATPNLTGITAEQRA
jgi:hypothetical protein